MNDSAIIDLESLDMAALLELYPAPGLLARNSIVTGTVVYKCNEICYVDIGQKSESAVTDTDDELTVGETYHFSVVCATPNSDGAVELSYRRAAKWSHLSQLAESGETSTARVTALAKSRKTGKVAGVYASIHGVRGFVPLSEITWMDKMDDLVDTMIPVKVLTVEPETGRSGNLILSQKKVVEGVRQESLAAITDGDTLPGVVKKLLDVGALVDIGNHLVGLVHKTEIASARNDSPTASLKVGDSVTVKVLSVNQEEGKISLSIKKAAQATLLGDLEEGEIITGAVARFESYGAFVNIGGIMDALLHISDQMKGEELTVGQVARFRVKALDRERGRISLSRKDVPEDEV